MDFALKIAKIILVFFLLSFFYENTNLNKVLDETPNLCLACHKNCGTCEVA